MASDEQVARNVLTRIGYKINHKELLDMFETIILMYLYIKAYYILLEYLKGKSTISSS